ncbi:hypothetical protein C4D60_Mb06t28170 [Musa balbisiana]|uniref:Uncharacterized protein n=1 Tax=Musa balbisiana TaxID=52838 RepID=A0A4S8IR85_MUSBA|nr:hypothetical protein C4D60_Mb06t28170 [Musa balbisiana]
MQLEATQSTGHDGAEGVGAVEDEPRDAELFGDIRSPSVENIGDDAVRTVSLEELLEGSFEHVDGGHEFGGDFGVVEREEVLVA